MQQLRAFDGHSKTRTLLSFLNNLVEYLVEWCLNKVQSSVDIENGWPSLNSSTLPENSSQSKNLGI